MADIDITSLSIKVEADASKASKGVDDLSASLSRLQKNSGLTKVINNLEKFSAAVGKLSGLATVAGSINQLTDSLNKLSGIQKLSGLNNALSALSKFPDIVARLDPARLQAFSAAVAPLSGAIGSLGEIQKLTGLNSVLNTLTKLPKISEDLAKMDLTKFGDQMKRVADAVRPLATEMEKVSQGFSKLPANIQRAIAANQKLTQSNKRVGSSFSGVKANLFNSLASLGLFTIGLRQMVRVLSDALMSFNLYIENVNLFSVSMGEFTSQGRDFTQRMQDVLGIDASEAMRNMGFMQNLTTSFGIAADKAYILSKNFTQLGYDMSSFFNLPVADAFQKLQSAIAGELEPIRRLGVDLSQARLQQELYALGVNALVTNLTQADKAILRYIATLKQTSNAQTDMGRTLNSPANMLRIFNQQIALFSRSVGSLMIPMLNALLPPLIALTRLLREAIMSLASFFGITVDFPQISGSVSTSLGGMSADIEEVGESAAAAAKELAYLIGGFDEINVLPSVAESAAGGAKGGAGSLLGGVDLPEYDMFTNLVESKVSGIADKLKKLAADIKKFFEPIMPLLKGLAAGILTLFAGSKILQFVKWLKGLFVGAGAFGAFGAAVAAFNAVFKETGNVFKAVGAGLAAFRAALPLTTKILGGIAGFVTVFVTSYDAVKKWTTGLMDGKTALANILVAVGLVGTALFVMLGPLGLVITGLGVLAGAIAGNVAGTKALNDEMMKNAFMNGEGIPVGAFINSIKLANDEILSSTNIVRDNKAAFLENNESIAKSAGEISTFGLIMANTSGDIAAKYIPQMQAAFDTLQTSIERNLKLIETTLIGTLVNAPQAAIDYLGESVPELTSIISQSVAGMSAELAEAVKQVDIASLALAKDPTNRGLQQAYNEALGAVLRFTDESSAAMNAFDLAVSGIKFTDAEDAANAMKQLGDISANTITQLKDAHDVKMQMLSQLDMSDAARERVQSAFQNIFELDVSRVLLAQTEAEKQIQASFESIVKKSTENAKPSVMDYTRALWVSSFDIADIKSNAQTMASENLAAQYRETLSKAIASASTKVQEVMKGFGLSIDTGLAEGVRNNMNVPVKATEDMIGAGIDATATKLDSHSPSQVYVSFGLDIDKGLANGIKLGTPGIVDAMRRMGNELVYEMQDIMRRLKQAASETILIRTIIEIEKREISSSASGSIKAMASGGVLTSPQVILAGEYGGASTNPEIVTPQNIMRETVTEANAGMVVAIVQAIQELQQVLEDKDLDVIISDKDIGASAARYARAQKRRTGLNPLTV